MSENSSGGSLKPVQPGLQKEYIGRWTGGGAAGNCTRVGDTGVGISSVNYNAATGQYQVTLTGSFQELTGYWFAHGGANTTPKYVKHVASNGTAGTINISVTDLATPSTVDLSTTDEISITIRTRSDGVYT